MTMTSLSNPDDRQNSQHQQLPEQVASYVRSLIFSGSIRPGEFVRLEPIAAALGVSNTPVREGLLSLRSDGFVQLVPRRGFMVEPFTQQDIRDLFWVQAQLASELAARAAKAISEDDLKVLDQILAQYGKAVETDDRTEISNLGHQFHRTINKAAASPRLATLLGAVVRHLPNMYYATIDSQVEDSRAEHPVLLEALRTHNARMARSVMLAHIQHGADHLIALLDARGLWSETST